MHCALLARNQLFEVLAVTARGGRAVHPVPRTRAAKHAEAAVQARERRASCMALDGLARSLSEASRAIAPGRQPRASTASPSAPKAGVLRM